MTAGEYEPEAIVRQRLLVRDIQLVRHAQCLQGLELRPLGLEDPFAPQAVDRAVARDPGDPRAGVLGKPVDRPAFDRDNERLLDGLLGGVEAAENADQGRDRPPGLVPEQAVDDLAARYDAASAVSSSR
jgi:hypothetical protein